MGIAVVKVSRELLPECLPLLRSFGGIVSVHYPTWYENFCDVKFVTTNVPDDGEHAVTVVMNKSVDGATVTLTATLKLINM